MILPFQILSEILEGDSISEGYTYGFSHSATILLDQITMNTSLHYYAKKLIGRLQERLDFSDCGTLLRMLFHLTHKRREIYIKSNFYNKTPEENKDLYAEYFSIEPKQHSLELIEKSMQLFDQKHDHFKIIKSFFEDELFFMSSSDDESDSIEEPAFDQISQINGNKHPEEEDDDYIETNSIEDDIDDFMADVNYYVGEDVYECNTSMEREINFDLEGEIIFNIASNLNLNCDLTTQVYSAWLEPYDIKMTKNMKINIRLEDINGTWKFFCKM